MPCWATDAIVILDGMAIFSAYQSAATRPSAAEEARTEYAQNAQRAGRATGRRTVPRQEDLDLVDFKAVQTADGR